MRRRIILKVLPMLTKMIAATIILIATLCLFAPIKLSAKIRVDLDRLRASMKIALFKFVLFDEQARLGASGIVCSGSVNAMLEYDKLDESGGINLIKSVTLDELFASVELDVSSASPAAFVFCNLLTGFVTQAATLFCHAKIGSVFCPNFSQNGLKIAVNVTANIFESLTFAIGQIVSGGKNGRKQN